MSNGMFLCAVIVSYNPGHNIFELAKDLIEQNCKVVIVDNGSSDSALEFIDQCEALGSVILKLGRNYGIGHALNVGCRFWTNQNYQWILTFDQDSMIGYDFVMVLSCVVLKNNFDPNVAMFAPLVEDAATSTTMQSAGPAKFVITSGSCISSAALRLIGYFNEELFIDYVDFDICIRFRHKNYTLLVVPNLKIIHSIGRMKEFQIPYTKLGFMTTNHDPLRRYYKHRNYTYMVRSYARTEAFWLFKQGFSLMLESLKILIAETNKFIKLKMILKGWQDGLFGIYGEYHEK